MKQVTLISCLLIVILINITVQVLSKDPCPSYEENILIRGNVKNATMAFDLLLNQEDEIKDSIVSTSYLKEKINLWNTMHHGKQMIIITKQHGLKEKREMVLVKKFLQR